MNNLFESLPTADAETIQVLLQSDAVKIERITSNGQPSPRDFWYDQVNEEWVLLIQGMATLEFENGEKRQMRAGDYLLIPSRLRHRVSEVSQDAVWLAMHLLQSPQN